ncbi:MAG: type II toxin-antitoxin system VapB family antitoxin [Granulicella sp.]
MYTMYMALHINNPETERNVRALAAATGETIADAINQAVKSRLQVVRPHEEDPTMMQDALAILEGLKRLPVLDPRSADEILGYDENGLPN